MTRKIELIGKRFWKLLVLNEGIPRKYSTRTSRTYDCICDCGIIKNIEVGHLTRGHNKSCGCSQHPKTHGFTVNKKVNPMYKLWLSIKSRCYYKSHKFFKYYGGRGINVCQEWIENPELFVKWCLSNGWKKGLQIDRINNDGNYSPDNCRFVTNRVNSLNKTKLYTSNKSGYVGISFCNTHKKWISQICVNGKRLKTGAFKEKGDAVRSRNEYIMKNNLEHEYKIQEVA